MVVYDRYGGDTHCLDHVATAVLSHLMTSGSATAAELSGSIQAVLAAGKETPLEETLAAALAELERLRLVRATD